MVLFSQLRELGLDLKLLNGELEVIKSQLDEELNTLISVFKDTELEKDDLCNQLEKMSENLKLLINTLIAIESQVSEIKKTKGDVYQIRYQKTKTNWEKLYGQVDNGVKLLREDKRKMTVTFSSGHPLDTELSDTDILTQGLGIFMSEEKDTKKLDISTISWLLETLRIDSDDLNVIRLQLIDLKRAADNNTRLCETLKNYLKDLLADKKKLRTKIKIMEQKLLFLQNQISEHPTQQEISAMTSEIINLKRKVPILNQEYLKLISSRENIQRTLRSRQQYRFTADASLRNMLKKLIEDNSSLQRLYQNVGINLSKVTAQLNELSGFVNQISRLKDLINSIPFDLNNKISNFSQLDNEMAAGNTCLQEVANQLSFIQAKIQQLQSQFDTVSTSTFGVESNIQEMTKDVTELLKMFTSVSGKLCHSRFEDGKVEKEEEFTKISETLTKDKKEIEGIVKATRFLEIEARKFPLPEASFRYPKPLGHSKDKLCWNDKFVSILGAVEELEIMAKEAKMDKDKCILESIMNRYRIILEKEDEEDDEHIDQEKYKMSRSFQSTYANQGDLYTISGRDILSHTVSYANSHQQEVEKKESNMNPVKTLPPLKTVQSHENENCK